MPQAEQYCNDVLSGRVVAGNITRLMCQRHIDDLETGHERGLYFDETAAKLPLAFFKLLKHSKGKWAGQTIDLEPWQEFIVWCLFGWKRADGSRRFRTAYIEIARKNGKTTLAAGLGLYLTVADGEAGAEVYTLATKLDQARIAHGEAVRMVKQSNALSKHLGLVRDNIHDLKNFSKFVPLGRDSKSLDGLNVHAAIADELHAWTDRTLWDVIETATGSRTQPLIIAITTAGFNRQSLCWDFSEYTGKILNGLVEDDSFFGAIYALDEEDDWENESNWQKANPNLEISKYTDSMKQGMKRALEMPALLNSFLRLHLNMWTRSEIRWMKPEIWAACHHIIGCVYDKELGGFVIDDPIDEEENIGILDAKKNWSLVDTIMQRRLARRPCYAGLDLSSTTDITAMVYVFPPIIGDPHYWVLCRFWVPDESMTERSKRDQVPYEAWERQGLITPTPGNVIDYDFILAQIGLDMQKYKIQELAFDRWGSVFVTNKLQSDYGFTVDAKEAKRMGIPLLVQFGQGFASMSSPMKDLERLILDERIQHAGNPVLAWMAHNLVSRQDPAGNVKPDKEKSTEKIDGIVALIMALGRALAHGEQSGVSVYEERGLLEI